MAEEPRNDRYADGYADGFAAGRRDAADRIRRWCDAATLLRLIDSIREIAEELEGKETNRG